MGPKQTHKKSASGDRKEPNDEPIINSGTSRKTLTTYAKAPAIPLHKIRPFASLQRSSDFMRNQLSYDLLSSNWSADLQLRHWKHFRCKKLTLFFLKSSILCLGLTPYDLCVGVWSPCLRTLTQNKSFNQRRYTRWRIVLTRKPLERLERPGLALGKRSWPLEIKLSGNLTSRVWRNSNRKLTHL